MDTSNYLPNPVLVNAVDLKNSFNKSTCEQNVLKLIIQLKCVFVYGRYFETVQQIVGRIVAEPSQTIVKLVNVLFKPISFNLPDWVHLVFIYHFLNTVEMKYLS